MNPLDTGPTSTVVVPVLVPPISTELPFFELLLVIEKPAPGVTLSSLTLVLSVVGESGL